MSKKLFLLTTISALSTLPSLARAETSYQPYYIAQTQSETSPTYTQTPTRQMSYRWTGLYAGLTLGGAFGSSDHKFITGTPVNDISPSGVIGGGEIGYNYQYGKFVFGVEGDASGADLDGHKTCTVSAFQCETDQDWFVTFRPRIGYAVGSFLPYLTGGLAVGDIRGRRYNQTTGIVTGDNNATEIGFVGGVGGEYKFASNWSVKAEYLYAQYRDASYPLSTGGEYKNTLNANIVRTGINYKF